MDDDETNEEMADRVARKALELIEKIADSLSKKVRLLPDKENRKKAIRAAEPSEQLMIHLYQKAKDNEDYETCDAVKELMAERGFEIPS